ncbi:MAG: fructosamine kinase family protein [Flavobacteriaceae bacterium]|nr:fructosamine kinase family protein [Flavobacteriaceae bacterium]
MESLNNILEQENLKLLNQKPLHGGDINEVFYLETDKGLFVLKRNLANRFPAMFEKEANGLRLLAKTHTFKIPDTIAQGEIDNHSYLLLEYISPGEKSTLFWETFGDQLARLHQNTAPFFGLDHDNYIGSLEQYNGCNIQNAAQFYIEKRLEPQLEWATKKGFTFKNLSSFYKNCANEIPNEPPALIHGDLWNGNYLVDKTGNPCLIDPAVCFASREMDLAMMQLFGGFPEKVFTIYNNNFPLENNWKNRLDLWQLYYLLVHLNLFGSGYYNQVNTIIKKYS